MCELLQWWLWLPGSSAGCGNKVTAMNSCWRLGSPAVAEPQRLRGGHGIIEVFIILLKIMDLD